MSGPRGSRWGTAVREVAAASEKAGESAPKADKKCSRTTAAADETR
jgi:hypothetical protein